MLRFFAIHLWRGRPALQRQAVQWRWLSTADQSDDTLELVEAKIFETLKAGAKCNRDKLSRSATF